MNLLALDTATEHMGLSLKTSEKADLFFSARLGLKHAQSLLLWIDRLLEQAGLEPRELNALVVNRGPGSFTGLRIAMATAKGMSQALGIPMISLSALDCYGQSLDYFPGLIIPLVDARKKRYYTRIYQHGQPQSDYLDLSIEEILALRKNNQPALLTGSAARKIFMEHKQSDLFLDPHWDLSPADLLAEWGQKALEQNPKGDEPGQGPLYLRKSEAELSLEERQKIDS
ncbi:MAG: tRNA (adenosine(37)-N6)-threonylcarbamoyltransferase complex dimerization subunit type 1 TsaB [Spirochaetales bacterium]|nr:tRNA (adenosine(37)-N6)-threonylcarbamoyltransferase complex dimerization subunit type 1 TsaB [Spirochaetales bacterium]